MIHKNLFFYDYTIIFLFVKIFQVYILIKLAQTHKLYNILNIITQESLIYVTRLLTNVYGNEAAHR